MIRMTAVNERFTPVCHYQLCCEVTLWSNSVIFNVSDRDEHDKKWSDQRRSWRWPARRSSWQERKDWDGLKCEGGDVTLKKEMTEEEETGKSPSSDRGWPSPLLKKTTVTSFAAELLPRRTPDSFSLSCKQSLTLYGLQHVSQLSLGSEQVPAVTHTQRQTHTQI